MQDLFHGSVCSEKSQMPRPVEERFCCRLGSDFLCGEARVRCWDKVNARITFQQETEFKGGDFVYASIQCDGFHLPISCAIERRHE
jgi:hypothetical protein